jgi:hypothetical protein
MAKRKQPTKKSTGLKTLTPAEDELVTTLETTIERGSAPETTATLPSAAATETTKSPNYAGILIANESKPKEKGTMGGVLISDKGDLYGLTCFHTVKQNKDFSKFLPDESFKIVSEDGAEVGFFNADTAILNPRLDIALIKLSGKFHNKTIDSPTKTVDIKDADKGTEVYFFNDRIKKKIKGFIIKVNQRGNWQLGKYENIIFVSNVMDEGVCERISDEGDSGSWLLRVSDNALIGVVFANSYEFTFVMPITEVLQAFQKKKIILTLNLLS